MRISSSPPDCRYHHHLGYLRRPLLSVRHPRPNPLLRLLRNSLCWHYAGNNVTVATCLAATNDKMVTFKDTFQMNIVYMVVNLIACMASIPVWKLLGYC